MALTDKIGTLESWPGNLVIGLGAPELVVPKVTLSQFVVEVLVIPQSASVVSQFVVEILIIPPAPTVISQMVVETLTFDPEMGSAYVGPWMGDYGGSIWID